MKEKLERVSWDAPNHRWIIAGSGKKPANYFVSWSAILGRYTCTCPDWRYRKMGEDKDCKHINGIVEILQHGTMEEMAAISRRK